VVGVFFAEGCDKGPRPTVSVSGVERRRISENVSSNLVWSRRIVLRSRHGLRLQGKEMDFSGASRKENEPKVVGIGPNKDVVDWFVEAGSFPEICQNRSCSEQALIRSSNEFSVKLSNSVDQK